MQYARSLDFIKNAVAQEAIVETTSNTFSCLHTHSSNLEKAMQTR